jgi:hypothetical protein
LAERPLKIGKYTILSTWDRRVRRRLSRETVQRPQGRGGVSKSGAHMGDEEACFAKLFLNEA